MPSDPIVINLNIVKQDRIRLFSSDKHTAMHHMAFQCMKEAFSHGIIPTVSSSRHTLNTIICQQECSKITTTVLTALVRMNHNTCWIALTSHCIMKRITHQLAGYSMAGLPSHDTTTK